MTARLPDTVLDELVEESRGDLYAPHVQSLVDEVRRLRSLLERAYPMVEPGPGTEDLQAELELEVSRIRAELRARTGN